VNPELGDGSRAERASLEVCLEMVRFGCGIAILGVALGCFAPETAAQVVEGAVYDPAPVRLDRDVTASIRPVTPMDLLTLRDPKGMSISPDGSEVAFVVSQAEYEANGYRSGLFVVGTSAGSQVDGLGTAGMPHWDDINQWPDEAPQWSPDSQWISYRTRMRATEPWEVSLWNLKTGLKEKVTSVLGDVETYRWCPGGSALFVTVMKPRPRSDTTNSPEGGILFNPAIHPYQVIPVLTQMEEAKEPGREYWVYDLKTEQQRPATDQEIAKWKPWSSTSAASQNPSLAKYDILGAAPSPDGTKVAYFYGVDNVAQSKTWAARLLVTSDHDRQILEVTPDAHRVDQFWWTADGSTLYFTEHDGRGHSAELWALGSEDLKPQLVYKADAGEYLSSFSSDDAGKVFVCLRENNTSPPQIAVIDRIAKSIRTIVDLNPDFSSLRKGSTERLEGTNSYGENWFAYLVKPLDFVPGKRYPLIVTTYRSGDYFLRGASGDENPIQAYAAQGFAVLCADSGWIRNRVAGDFDATLLNWASPTGSIVQAVQRLAQEGIIDLSKVGIAGFSHGEEIAGYALIHSDLFHAASGAQNYDPFFYFLGSDEWHEIFQQWRLGGWSGGELNPNWRKIAMSMNAEQIVTPILQNASDTEYLITLSTYRSLRDVDRPIELYIYPNELHVRNQPKHRLEIYERNLDWFRFWLKDEQDSDPRKAEQYRRWTHLREQAAKAREKSAAKPIEPAPSVSQ
jgi:dipeptidyl aminopeptidase/acylaminoacyl peptidase